MVAPAVPIGLFFGRIANFINGELWGRPTDLPWGMIFCSPNIATNADGSCVAGEIARHPSQLYEAGLEGVVLFLILRLATHRGGWLRRRGALTGLFLLFYGLFRISLENVRMPDAGLRDLPLRPVTVGMMLSAPDGHRRRLAGLARAQGGGSRGRGRLSLARRLIQRINDAGPITVAEYMDALPARPARRLLRDPPGPGRGRRLHHRPARLADVRRTDRRLGGGSLARAWVRRRRSGSSNWDRATGR